MKRFPARRPCVVAGTVTTAALMAVAGVAQGSASATEPRGAPSAEPNVVTVKNAHDAGPGSLRAAIGQANDASAGIDTIRFHLPGTGHHLIRLRTLLPPVTETVTIDGYSQPGTSPATDATGADLGIAIVATGLDHALQVDTVGSLIRGLVIRDALGDGLRVVGDDNTINGNSVGLTSEGRRAGNGGNGLFVVGHGNDIGGSEPADRNVVSANDATGIFVRGFGNNVFDNMVGTDPTGRADRGNGGFGVVLDGSFNEVGGGLRASTASVISANGSDGVFVASGSGNQVIASAIGTDVTGTVDLGNGGSGVQVSGTQTFVAGNLISGNGAAGIHLQGDGTEVVLNDIGLSSSAGSIVASANASRPVPLRNDGDGILLDASDAVIGRPGEGNSIGGNGLHGIEVLAGHNHIESNDIGTDSRGTPGLGNQALGILLAGSRNVVGGDTADTANVISGNNGDGLFVIGPDNQILGNLVGTDRSGASAVPNVGDGIAITTTGTQVSDNTVAFNRFAGIKILAGSGNPLLGNRIFDNGALGIDLFPQGVTPNDPGDKDAGPNDLLNSPEVTTAGPATPVPR